jgi:outer membrane protein assembly factor BamB
MSKFPGVFLVVLLGVNVATADNWPAWRGPQGNNVVLGTGFPVSWGESDNIAWKVKLPGWGTSTPVIWDDRIFVTCADEDNNKNALLCLDRKGNQLWRADFGAIVQSRNRKAGGANPSPATDGTHVFAYYKSGDLACVEFDGNTVWKKNLQAQFGRDRLNWDLGTSPILTDDFVVIAVMHAGPSYVVAFEKRTGKVAWKQDRDLGAPAEARDSYSTPIVVKHGEQEYVTVLGADHVTTYAASDGKELWRVGGLNPEQRVNFRSIASPVVFDEMVFAPYARGATLTAIHWPKTAGAEAEVAWTVRGNSADVPCPVATDGKVYVCGDRGDVSCLDAESGDVIWEERLPRNRYPFSSSPVIAGGKLYATREDGTTFVLELSNPPKLIATNVLRENTYATPVFVDGQIFLRTSAYLFCIDKR